MKDNIITKKEFEDFLNKNNKVISYDIYEVKIGVYVKTVLDTNPNIKGKLVYLTHKEITDILSGNNISGHIELYSNGCLSLIPANKIVEINIPEDVHEHHKRLIKTNKALSKEHYNILSKKNLTENDIAYFKNLINDKKELLKYFNIKKFK